MPVVRISVKTTLAGQENINTFHYFHATHLPTGTDVAELLDDFETKVVPALKGVMSSQVTFEELVGYAYNLGYSIDEPLTGTGAITLTAAETIPPDIALIVKRVLGDTFLNDGGAPYTGNRPVRRSHVYLSGLPTAAMQSSGFNDGGLPAGNFDDLNDAMVATLSTTTFVGTWYHNVFGFPLPERETPVGSPVTYPERPAVVAPVLGIDESGFTNLRTRDR